MYIRFTTLKVDDSSHSFQGIFQAAFALRDTGDLASYEELELNEALAWLKEHLVSPACLRKRENYRALSWFDPRARKPLQYIWRLVHVLKEHGHQIEVHKTNDPGIIIYEDGWQVVAKPRRKPRKT